MVSTRIFDLTFQKWGEWWFRLPVLEYRLVVTDTCRPGYWPWEVMEPGRFIRKGVAGSRLAAEEEALTWL
jgi:hypothetical protein